MKTNMKMTTALGSLVIVGFVNYAHAQALPPRIPDTRPGPPTLVVPGMMPGMPNPDQAPSSGQVKICGPGPICALRGAPVSNEQVLQNLGLPPDTAAKVLPRNVAQIQEEQKKMEAAAQQQMQAAEARAAAERAHARQFPFHAPTSPGMAMPNRYQFDLGFQLMDGPYFNCDYTSRTCIRGAAGHGIIVGEVLADDRTTVLGHIGIFSDTMRVNYDTGQVQALNKTVQLKEDLPAFCLQRIPTMTNYIVPQPPCDLTSRLPEAYQEPGNVPGTSIERTNKNADTLFATFSMLSTYEQKCGELPPTAKTVLNEATPLLTANAREKAKQIGLELVGKIGQQQSCTKIKGEMDSIIAAMAKDQPK